MNYTSLAAKAADMIKRAGGAITYRTFSDSFSTTTGANTRTPSTTAAHGVMLDYAAREIDGSIVQRSDRRVLTIGIGTPKLNDELDMGGSTWVVVGVKSVKPDAATAVVHDLQVRP